MLKFISPPGGHRLEKAITYLVRKYVEKGKNSKPVIFHSLDVAFYLLDQQYDLELAEAAILHDLIEDAAVEKNDIALEFGEKTAGLVDALSFRDSISDREEQYREMFDRVKRAGREALIIKCADVLSNSLYIHLAGDSSKQHFLVYKLKYFLELSKADIGKEAVWHDLKRQYQLETRRLKREGL